MFDEIPSIISNTTMRYDLQDLISIKGLEVAIVCSFKSTCG
jgi:hypothetical protein